MKFFIHGQNLKVAQRIIASGTARILTADFRFSPEWDGMRKYAHFEQNDKKYPVLIENDKITADKNLNLGQGVWEVWVHGNRFDDDESFERITTVKAKISVDPSGLCGDPLPIEPPSFGEQLDERVSALEAGGGGGGSGTTDHSKLTNRNKPDQHPMEAITGLAELRDKINTFLDADDSTLDQLTELIQAIKANQGTIEGLTNGKVNVSDIVNDLTTGGANKVLSAEMGKELKRLIDAVPDWAMSPEKPAYNAQEVGALSQSELQSGVDRALEQAKQSGEFDGKDGKDGTDGKPGRDGTDGKPGTNGKDGGHYTPSISQPSPDTMRIEFTGSLPDMPPVDPTSITLPQGGSGSDISLGVTGASVGQIVEIEEVDESGKPKRWKAVDKPSGAGLQWTTIADITTKEEVSRILVDMSKYQYMIGYLNLRLESVGTGDAPGSLTGKFVLPGVSSAKPPFFNNVANAVGTSGTKSHAGLSTAHTVSANNVPIWTGDSRVEVPGGRPVNQKVDNVSGFNTNIEISTSTKFGIGTRLVVKLLVLAESGVLNV